MKAISRPLLAISLVLATHILAAESDKPAAMKVLVAPVIKAQLQQTLPLSGTLVSPTSSDLAARVSGYVKTLHVDIGDRVTQGQPLLSLDDKIIRLNLQSTEAARDEADILHRDAQRLAKEAKRLASSKHLSQTEYQTRQARSAATGAKATQLNAQHAIQAEQLNRHTLRAPFAGVIANKLTETGQWVGAASSVFTLAQMDPLYLELQVPERFFGRLQKGATVTLKTSLQETVANAQVERIVPVSNANTRTFMVRALVANPDWSLLPGMSVKAQVALAHQNTAATLQVPADAVVRKANGSLQVWVVRNGEHGKVAQPVEVSIGRSAGNRVEVHTQQLETGDSVVILGNENLKAGQPVITEEAG